MMGLRRSIVPLVAGLALATGCGGGSSSHREVADASVDRGATAIQTYGCGSCHQISGIDGATGRVGPSLHGFSDRLYVAGSLPNTTANLVRWIRYPQAVYPGTVMPDLGVTDRDARDIAAYLYQH
jgi:cytochrome c2